MKSKVKKDAGLERERQGGGKRREGVKIISTLYQGKS